jgi:RNA polymerase sigma factor (sigma-70 family)
VNAREHFEALYLDHAGAVKAYALRRTPPGRADDVVAEVFLVAWRRLEEVPPDARAWLLGVARRVMANERRGSARQEAVRARLKHERTPSAVAAASEPADRRVLDALGSLRESDREALLLVAWEGLSHRDASRVLGVRETTFSVRLHRARRRFRRALGGSEVESNPMTARLETNEPA